MKNQRTILTIAIGTTVIAITVLALSHPCTWAPTPPPSPEDGASDTTEGQADGTAGTAP